MSYVAHWFQGERLLHIIHRYQSVASAKDTNSYNISEADSVSQHTVSLALLCMYQRSRWPKYVPVIASSTCNGPMNIVIGMGENCMVWWMSYSCPSHRGARANTRISIRNPGYHMHSCSEISLWTLYYHGFMVHFKTHNPFRTISDVCVLPERRYRPRTSVHDNYVSRS